MGMELLEGGSLYDMLKSKEILSSKQIQTILVCILKGLAFMHSKDIMHRDLKVENILFRQANKLDSLVIADFGLATHVHEKVYLFCRCGTPGYVAPEVINVKDMKSHYSSVCDVYSAGLIFYLLVSGKPAFNAKSYNSVVK
jgi:serine/threonine protein kinase